MNKKLIRLTEQDLHRIVKESVHKIINEIGDTEKGQDALGQAHGRAIARAAKLGDKDAIARKLRNTARDAAHKAYSEAEKNNLFAGIGSSFDNGIDKGYHKAKTNETRINRVVKESVNRVLKESDETAWEYSHLSSDEGIFIVVANFYDYTYCFKKKEIERFDNSNEAKQYAIRMIRDKNFINDLVDDIYDEMDEEDETNVDDVNIEVYRNNIDERGNNVIFTTKSYRTLNKN